MGAPRPGRWLRAVAVMVAVLGTAAAMSAPFVPASDDQVVEQWPGGAERAEDRRLRRGVLAAGGDEAGRQDAALALAQRYLLQARTLGEPRRAGQALALLAPWSDAAGAPLPVLWLRARLQQHLHEFDAALATLQALLGRDPLHAQGWLELATLHRVQGRLAESDRACARLLEIGAGLYGQACRAENDGLRGRVEAARAGFSALLAQRGTPAVTRAWLWTSVGELESRAGRPAEAERAWRAALALDDDAYTALLLADQLIAQGRTAEALDLLRGRARSDAVLLRLALAGRQRGEAAARVDEQALRERLAQSAERPGSGHDRERALFALHLDQDPPRALALARRNLERQREPADLLLLAQAAHAAGDPEGLGQARRLAEEIGVHDERLQALR